MGKSDSPTAAGKSSEFNKTTVPSSQQSRESVSPQKRPGVRIIIPKRSHEVIDLCDDDAHSESSQPAASVHTSAATHPDEDNVIFVSYIPPKTESESTQDLRQKTQKAPVKEADKTSTSGSNSGTERKSPDGATGTLTRRKPVHGMSVNTVKNAPRVGGSAAMNAQNNEGPNMSSRRSAATQQSKGVEVNVERKSPADCVIVAPAAVQMAKKAASSPSAAQQVVGKQISLVNVTPNQVCLDLPLQQQKVNIIAVIPQMANREKMGRLPGPLPVPVKAPAVPRGRHLQILPNVSHRPNSPIKWVVEDEDILTAPVLDPANFSISSEILRVVAEREGATKHWDALTNPVSGADRKSLDGTTDADRRRQPGRSVAVNTVKNSTRVCGPAAMNTQNNEGPSFSSQQSTAGQPSESMEVQESPANPNNSDSSKGAMDTPKMKDLKGPRESCSCAKVKTERELLEGSAPPSAPTHIEPLKCSHIKLNARRLHVVKNERHQGDTSLKGSSRDLETEPAFGYVEPIDEDFLATEEKDNPNAQDAAGRTQTQTCAYLNTRRMGRTRKRTMCPCCVPGAQDPMWEEPGEWAWATEQTSKKGRRKKAVRKAVKTSGRTSCLRVKDKCSSRRTDEGPARDSLSSDPNELRRLDEIRRMKELLKEQEAALEEMRH
ncbi:hypothetical protein FQN60_002154 [Etheostoma spectabile]|uniref:Uncharacterized protein n=1 Tax=Etheostoma spectabile TaxID=54343 RepID=A0A5J5DDU8_9PERO|nr:hypothetical protein FQN60_002154 [Etheostoma spectabile]